MLRFRNWEWLGRSTFMSVEPLRFGSILDSKDFNSSSILTVFSCFEAYFHDAFSAYEQETDYVASEIHLYNVSSCNVVILDQPLFKCMKWG